MVKFLLALFSPIYFLTGSSPIKHNRLTWIFEGLLSIRSWIPGPQNPSAQGYVTTSSTYTSAKPMNGSKGAGMPALFCNKRGLTLTARSNAKTAGGNVQDPGRNPLATPDVKVDLLPCAAKQLHHASPGKQQDWLLWVATLTPGGRGQVCVRTFAICTGWLQSYYKNVLKATKHDVAIRIGLAAKQLRKCSKDRKK